MRCTRENFVKFVRETGFAAEQEISLSIVPRGAFMSDRTESLYRMWALTNATRDEEYSLTTDIKSRAIAVLSDLMDDIAAKPSKKTKFERPSWAPENWRQSAHWTDAEDDNLLALYEARVRISDIAKEHGRGVGSILSRLGDKFGIFVNNVAAERSQRRRQWWKARGKK